MDEVETVGCKRERAVDVVQLYDCALAQVIACSLAAGASGGTKDRGFSITMVAMIASALLCGGSTT